MAKIITALLIFLVVMPAYALEVAPAAHLEASFDGRMATFTNTGNAAYDGKVLVTAAKGGLSYTVERQVTLKPKESIQIDMFNELPKGTYDITVGGQEYKSVAIQDMRSGFKRVTQGMGAITGALVGLPGAVSLQMATLLMAAIALIAVVAFYIQLRKSRARKKIV